MRPKCSEIKNMQQHKSYDPSVLWRSAAVQCKRHVGSCFKKHAKQFVEFFRTGLAQKKPLPAVHSGVECISCDLQHSMASVVSLGALCCGSSPHLAISTRPSALRRQSPFCDWELEPLFGGSRILAEAGGELLPVCAWSSSPTRSGQLPRTAAQWLSVALRVRWCFPGVHDGLQVFWSVRRPDANDRQPLSAATTRIWCCTSSGMLVYEFRKRVPKNKKTNAEYESEGLED